MPKTRLILAIFILTGIAFSGYAQVNQDELGQSLPQIVFINYEGPYTRMDTREQIRQLGVVLGRQVSEGIAVAEAVMERMSPEQRRQYTYKVEAGPSNRYFVIHSITGPEENRIDADIFGLGVDTALDHVRNLRVVLQGYLQEAYSYSANDALLLAQYISIYNAVYRGSWDYFTNRYKTPVVSALVRERAGLSIRYDEWPGRTMMLIPLGYGGLSSIDTSAITDQRVIEELRKEDDMSIPIRQEMVDLKEREADQAEQRAQIERETARREEREAARERQEVAEERQRVQEDRQAGRITQREEQRRQEELDRREEAATEREQQAAQRREEADRLEEFAERKTEEAQQERQEIARDQQSIIDEEERREREGSSAIAGEGSSDGVFGVIIERDSPTIMGRIVHLSPSGRVIRRSPMDTVHARTITLTGGKIIAIAGENRGNGAVRLVEVNQNNLEMAKQGDDDLMTGSLLWVNGGDIYAITVDLKENKCYLGRFDTNLALQAKSVVTVNPNASVSIQQGRLLTQKEDGSILMLNPADLTE